MDTLIKVLFLAAHVFCLLAALLFIARLSVAPFSTRVSEQVRRHPVIHVIWGCFTLVVCFVFWIALNPFMWPPQWIERRAQRRQILERIQPVGGWVALKRDCDALANKYKDDPYGFRWLYGLQSDTDALPPAIAALKPKEVEFYSRAALQQFGSESIKWFGSNQIVRISIFGAHATGGHDQPWLGLDVVCGVGGANYCPVRLRSATPFRYWVYRKVADDIYEFY